MGNDIKDLIKGYMEDTTYQGSSEFTYNYRVEQVSDTDYEVYIVNSFADIIYSFSDVMQDEDGYSAIVRFVSCKINGFEVGDVNGYLDNLEKYIERCEIVAGILDSVDTWLDDTRTYF